jgi:murein DD-endopeptidase MepM/ murein hydrolase activator NlpD
MPLFLLHKSQKEIIIARLLILLLQAFVVNLSNSQPIKNAQPGKPYRPPLNIPLKVTGNFCDIRSNSFHFGLDFSTNEVQGLPVFAVNDGFVSRIKIESGGYGKAVYINHSDGKMSVYSHLVKLCNKLDRFVKNEQYKRKSFSVDLMLEPLQFPVLQGDTIAFSGNAGFSSGPHLHFELRDIITQCPINCIVPEFQLNDTSIPVIKSLYIYHAENYMSGNLNSKVKVDISGKNGIYKLKNIKPVVISDSDYFGIETYDCIMDQKRKLTFYSLILDIDSSEVFKIVNDKMPFEQAGYVNSYIDFDEKKKNDLTIYKIFKWQNQDVIIFKDSSNNGAIHFNDTLLHKIHFEVSDYSGNKANLEFIAKCRSKKGPLSYVKSCKGNFIRWNKDFTIQNRFFRIEFPHNSLFDNACISIDTSLCKNTSLNKFTVGNINIPVKKPFRISIPVNGLNHLPKEKLLILNMNDENKPVSLGGEYKNNNITAPAKTFGTFALGIDTIPPRIIPLNIRRGKNMIDEDTIKIKISDTMSGINEYNGTIDDNWVLFEYDAKNDLLTYAFDSSRLALENKKHLLKLAVSDKKGNKSTLKIFFIK